MKIPLKNMYKIGRNNHVVNIWIIVAILARTHPTKLIRWVYAAVRDVKSFVRVSRIPCLREHKSNTLQPCKGPKVLKLAVSF